MYGKKGKEVKVKRRKVSEGNREEQLVGYELRDEITHEKNLKEEGDEGKRSSKKKEGGKRERNMREREKDSWGDRRELKGELVKTNPRQMEVLTGKGS